MAATTVDFPAPFGPKRASVCPASMAIETLVVKPPV